MRLVARRFIEQVTVLDVDLDCAPSEAQAELDVVITMLQEGRAPEAARKLYDLVMMSSRTGVAELARVLAESSCVEVAPEG